MDIGAESVPADRSLRTIYLRKLPLIHDHPASTETTLARELLKG